MKITPPTKIQKTRVQIVTEAKTAIEHRLSILLYTVRRASRSALTEKDIAEEREKLIALIDSTIEAANKAL